MQTILHHAKLYVERGVFRSALCAELSRMRRDGLILYGKRRFTIITEFP